jgi:hypothetical protein
LSRKPLGTSARYLTNPAYEPLTRHILEELPYLSFEEATRWYKNAYEPLMEGEQPERDLLAFLGCNDRYFLLAYLCGRNDVKQPWLYDRCREVQLEPDGYLDLWAREHYKSTIITFAGCLQEILADPEHTIGIFSFNQKIARDFVFQVKNELERNPDLKFLYPDVLYDDPVKESPLWTKDAITVKRASNPKEATLEGWGLVTGMPTGRHFRLRVYDDVVTDSSVTNPDMVKKTTEAWELSDNLGGGERRTWHIGTRYSFGDTYGVIFERNLLKPRLYAATDTGKKDGNPVFMDVKTWENKKRIQASTLAAQMLQNPLAGNDATFNASWLRPYLARPKTLNVYIMGDPSKGTGPRSDRSAIAVVGLDSTGNKYLLDGYRHRMKTSERWDALKNLYIKWRDAPGVQLCSVGWERYGMQTDDEYFRERMERENFAFPIKELNWTRDGKQSKKDRVERLEPDFRDSRFYLPALVHEPGADPKKGESPMALWSIDAERDHVITRRLHGKTNEWLKLEREQQAWRVVKPIVRKDENGQYYDVTRALMEEMLFFPFAPKDDLVDAVSRIYDMEARPPSIYELPNAIAELESQHQFEDA